MIELVRRWWRQPDHFYWLANYLTSHGALPVVRAVMTATVLALGAIPVAMMWSSAGPTGWPQRVIAVTVGACCVAMAALWMGPKWPTKASSSTFVVTGTLCIAAACLIVSAPGPALMGCVAFAPIGGYIAFFHSARFTVFNVSVALATAAVETFRIALYDSVLAGCLLTLVIVANVSVQFTGQALVQALGLDVLNSDTDALTGLLNRRAFYRHATQLVANCSRRDDRYLAIAMIDLDNFKRLNDTHGHATGDRALQAVGHTLRENCRRSAVVARVGGEEFLIAEVIDDDEVVAMSERIRRAIAMTPPQLTASIGTVVIPLPGLVTQPPRELLDSLVADADAAMYLAKRAGGDRVRHGIAAQLAGQLTAPDG
jgi:diguanylate cyclase (GGDEF)-like protein